MALGLMWFTRLGGRDSEDSAKLLLKNRPLPCPCHATGTAQSA